MAVTILEALQNAQHNLGPNGGSGSMAFMRQVGYDQLSNAVTLLEKGYDLYDEVEPLLDQYGDVDRVPDRE